MAAPTTADYIIIGGGLSGVVIASRLAQSDHNLSVILIEAGPDSANHPLVSSPLACFGAHHSEIDYDYSTTPQAHLDNRKLYNSGGKILSGSSAINYGTWTRGPSCDYDLWAEKVQDSAWSYEGLLPYFKKTESCVKDGVATNSQHGFEGPMKLAFMSETGRKYPLDDSIDSAWTELGLQRIGDGNRGSPLGVAEKVENFGLNGTRQPASSVYDLSRVTVLTNTTVHKVIVSTGGTIAAEPVATGVQLLNGDIISAKREVILSAGVYRTPQILMLSGIGPATELIKHNVTVLIDSPEVGQNFHDHPATCMWWKLREPEKGLALGSSHPRWSDPKNGYDKGLPTNSVVFEAVPRENLKTPLEMDGENPEKHDLIRPGRVHLESFVSYAPAQASLANVAIPFDGSHITTCVINLAPNSRGSITLASADPRDKPVINPNYFATETDKAVQRYGMRRALALIKNTRTGREIVDEETTPVGFPALELGATDDDLDARMRRVAVSFFHGAGSASMGKVIDTKLRVKGVKKLRVCDASVLPVGIAAHLQACIYAVAEKGADIILQDSVMEAGRV